LPQPPQGKGGEDTREEAEGETRGGEETETERGAGGEVEGEETEAERR